jgi:hypothetical protein
LKHGYFVSKQPGPDFQHHGQDYHVQARKEETEFFESDPRWTGDWEAFRDRCGTEAIQKYLSQELAAMIVKSMPDIEKKIANHSQAVDAALHALPPLPGHNVQHVVRSSLQNFSNRTQRILEGSGGFLSHWSQLSVDFGDAILKMRPMFTYTDISDTALPEVIDIDDSEDDDMDVQPATPSNRKRGPNGFETPQAQRFKSNDGSYSLSRESSVSGGRLHQTKQEGNIFSIPTRLQMNPPATPRQQVQPKQTAFTRFWNSGKSFMSIAEIRGK